MFDVRLIGIGAKHLSATCLEQPQGIILAGFAGALDPTLQIGQIVIDGWPSGDAMFRHGKIHTALEVIATPADKTRLFHESGAAAVDMEGDIVRRFAESAGARFIHLRAISDTAAQTLDPALLGFVDEFGAVRPGALAFTLVRRPTLVPHLLRIGLNARKAASHLQSAIVRVCEELSSITTGGTPVSR